VRGGPKGATTFEVLNVDSDQAVWKGRESDGLIAEVG
jgi:hypothetical protein